jgi:hypothetical protein
MATPKTAGILLFVHKDALPEMEELVSKINGTKRVSPEVLSLHLVTPTREDVKNLSAHLSQQPSMQHLERIHRLRGNNSLKDLTAIHKQRLAPEFVKTHKLVVGLETFNPEFKRKYPEPNLTLPAGKVEEGESVKHAAHRELLEETRIRVDPLMARSYIGLFRGGIRMFVVEITHKTRMALRDGVLDIGTPTNILEYYKNILDTSETSRVVTTQRPHDHTP